MKVATQAKTITWITNAIIGAPKTRAKTKAATIATVARIFARREIAPLSCQSLIGGPNVGCSVSQRCRTSDERAKQNAASSRNGTVGNNGRAMPIVPRPTHMNPHTAQTIRMGPI